MKVIAIALNTFKEAVRNRVLYVLLFFAVMILLGAWVASSLAIFGQEKIVRDFGVGSINIISVLIAVFVGVGLVYNDLDKKTIYTIVSKPISRWHFIVGKYLGLLLTICVNIVFMTFFFLIVLNFRHLVSQPAEVSGLLGALARVTWLAIQSIFMALANVASLGFYANEVTSGIMQSSFLTMLEMSIITAFAILFSSFSSPILSAFMTVVSFLIGRLNEDLWAFANHILMFRAGGSMEAMTAGQRTARAFSEFAAYITPNLSFFDQRDAIANFEIPTIAPASLAYAVCYTAVVLLLSAIIFNRRNFK